MHRRGSDSEVLFKSGELIAAKLVYNMQLEI